jgi:rhodanese-related sulfurtransferase/DNA-binding transcriptional ArsR family regulator
MSNPNLKHQLYAQLARIGKALAHGNRLELLEHLAQGERSVEALAKISGLSIANTSQHLQLLRQSGLVAARKEGLYVYYRIADDAVLALIVALRNLAEARLAEVERLVRGFLAVKDDLEPVPRETLIERVREGLVTVIDVRPPEEYQAGHLPGAINLPLKELEQRLQELPREQEIVAYCRGPYCVLAYEAVSRLRARGFRARRLVEGFPEWKLSGLPVESGNKIS